MTSTQKESSCEKIGVALNSLGEKSCEIKGSSQEMAAIMLKLINLVKAVCIVKIYLH